MAETDKGICFIWKIRNFSMLPHQYQEMLTSPNFTIDSKDNINMFLRLYPKGNKLATKNSGNMSLFLCNVIKGSEDLKFNCSFTVVSTESFGHLSKRFENQVIKHNFGFFDFVLVSTINNSKNLYLPEDTLTIRCEINVIDETSISNVKVNTPASKTLIKCTVCHTSVQVRRDAITWPIRNIKELIQQEEKASIFLPSSSKDFPSLKLLLNFTKTTSEGTTDCFKLSIKQMCLSLKDEKIFAKCKITVISANSPCQAFKESAHLFKKKLNDVWHFPPFISETMLMQEKFLYADDMLYLLCEFAFSCKDNIYHSIINDLSCTYDTRKKRKINELGSSIENIYSSKKFCDIKLQVGKNIYPYYKAILCARSSVFSTMFETNMIESNSNVVKITDIEPDTLKRMLEFMHLDVMQEDLPPEDLCKLYEAADKYNIESLKRRCSVLLISALSMENVSNLLALADAHNDGFLMIALENFISSHGQEMINSPQWKSFVDSNPKLSANIMLQMLAGKYKIVEMYTKVNGKA